MIRSYKNSDVEIVAKGKAPKGFPANIVKVAQRKLGMLDDAEILEDLLAPWEIGWKL